MFVWIRRLYIYCYGNLYDRRPNSISKREKNLLGTLGCCSHIHINNCFPQFYCTLSYVPPTAAYSLCDVPGSAVPEMPCIPGSCLFEAMVGQAQVLPQMWSRTD